jgi:hypothetical protein
MRKLLTVSAIALLALSFTACGGDDDDGSTEKPGDPSGEDFVQLLDQADAASFKVAYSTGFSEEFTVAQDREGRRAFSTGDSVIIDDGQGVVTSCVRVDDDVTCTQLSGPQAEAALRSFTTTLGLARTSVDNASKSNGFEDSSTEEIAGRSAKCVTFRVQVTYSACADEETGALLKWQTTSGAGELSLLATEVSEPDASDFEPPKDA